LAPKNIVLAAGGPGVAGLKRALGDANVLVRTAAAAALANPPDRSGARP